MSNKEKRCGKCGKVKPLSEFYLQSLAARGEGYQSKCKECSKIYTHEYHKKRKGKRASVKDKEEGLLSTYGKADVEVKGKLVMRDGKVLDLRWWKGKLRKRERVREEDPAII